MTELHQSYTSSPVVPGLGCASPDVPDLDLVVPDVSAIYVLLK